MASWQALWHFTQIQSKLGGTRFPSNLARSPGPNPDGYQTLYYTQARLTPASVEIFVKYGRRALGEPQLKKTTVVLVCTYTGTVYRAEWNGTNFIFFVKVRFCWDSSFHLWLSFWLGSTVAFSSDVVNDKTLFPTNVVYTTHDWHDTIDAVRSIVNVRWNRW